MNYKDSLIFSIFLFLLYSCSFSTQSRYNYSEVGKIQVANYGTVVKVRDIDIVSNTSGAGGLIGGVGGGVGGLQVGSGGGQVVAGVAGAVGGALVGSALEQAIRNRGGVEYTVVLRNGKTLTVAQNISEKDVLLKKGDRVIVQINGEYQRVLPANDLPTEIEQPKGITFK
jgi:outer membrane lipoprotein SlyB